MIADWDDIKLVDLVGTLPKPDPFAEDEREAEECAARWYAATRAD